MLGGSHFYQKKKKNPLVLVFETENSITGLIVLIFLVQALENWLGYKFLKCFYKANLKMS